MVLVSHLVPNKELQVEVARHSIPLDSLGHLLFRIVLPGQPHILSGTVDVGRDVARQLRTLDELPVEVDNDLLAESPPAYRIIDNELVQSRLQISCINIDALTLRIVKRLLGDGLEVVDLLC